MRQSKKDKQLEKGKNCSALRSVDGQNCAYKYYEGREKSK